MTLVPGFKSDRHREGFHKGGVLHQRGGALARICGARLRARGVCSQLALSGEVRCLRHGGPDAARRFRDRQLEGMKTGTVAPEVFAHSEAKRARNALVHRWRKDPRVPGRTVDLGADEAAFAEAARGLGVDLGALYPALADWLRWRWLRHQRDRNDAGRWVRAVQHDLPRRSAVAATAVQWAELGGHDKRTRVGRALKAALTAGTQNGYDVAPAKPSVALTPLPVRPWKPHAQAEGWKRRLPDRVTAKPAPSQIPRSIGRPRALPDRSEELADLAAILRGAEPQVRAMFDRIAGQGDGLRFLRDLADYARAPDNAGARARWMVWVFAQRET